MSARDPSTVMIHIARNSPFPSQLRSDNPLSGEEIEVKTTGHDIKNADDS
jgi:hypothetical protein